jgi:hypothetical protein
MSVTRHSYLRLLELSPFERRRTESNPGGGWRFGTKVIGDCIVERMVASGRAGIEGNQVYSVGAEPAE